MKRTIKCTKQVAALLGVLLTSGQLGAVTLLLDSKTAGDGAETINVTGEHLSEVSLPIYESFSKGTEQGYAWGGFQVGEKNVIFTNTRIFDYAGNNTVRAAQLIGDENGMGIDSNARYEGERQWMIDGDEGYSWSANHDLQFLGVQLRAGWDGAASYGKKQFSISSPAWVNLKGVKPRYGIEYVPATGTFLVSNNDGSVSMDLKVTVEELVGLGGPRLDLPAGVEFTLMHTGEHSDLGGLALRSISFDPGSGAYQPIPEPKAYSLIVSLLAASLAISKRRIR